MGIWADRNPTAVWSCSWFVGVRHRAVSGAASHVNGLSSIWERLAMLWFMCLEQVFRLVFHVLYISPNFLLFLYFSPFPQFSQFSQFLLFVFFVFFVLLFYIFQFSIYSIRSFCFFCSIYYLYSSCSSLFLSFHSLFFLQQFTVTPTILHA